MKKINWILMIVSTAVLALPVNGHSVDLSNYSVRAYVTDGNGVAIGGFVVTDGAHKMLVRVKGPSLPAIFENRLSDPVVSVFQGNTLVASNDDWGNSSRASDIAQLGLAPSDPREPALIEIFEPGAYTIVVSGKGGAQGVVLLEVLDLGEEARLYDDFSQNTLDRSLWTVIAGQPVVRDGYFYCNSDEYSSDLGSYACKVISTAESNRWGIAVVYTQEQTDANISIKMCPGEIDNLKVCGSIEVQKK